MSDTNEKKEVIFKLEQGECAMELTFDSWKKFVNMMRGMAPFWGTVNDLESMMALIDVAMRDKGFVPTSDNGDQR